MWVEPLEMAEQFADHDTLVLLHAARPAPDGSWRSLLAIDPIETITGGWDELASALARNPSERWFGYLGYELGEAVTAGSPAFPPLWMTRFATVYVFDHHTHSLTPHVLQSLPQIPQHVRNAKIPVIASLTSNMTRAEYLETVNATLAQIQNGEFYQANITRKFYGEFETSPSPFALYRTLTERSPAAYSAFIKMGDRAILSSSPESFLNISTEGKVSTRPIKGTARRSGDAATDTAIYHELATSTKNRAENLMIVDLMRHDLARSCESGSIAVEDLFKITEHPHLYHMVSTVSGQKRPEISTLQLIRDCFPPGSMTGAPKRAAVEWCQQNEKMQRGVYSGALGWIASDGSADLSVIIRTLLLDGNRFEFQVGGGIVTDSTPEAEWEETLTKAMGIASALGISLDELRNL